MKKSKTPSEFRKKLDKLHKEVGPICVEIDGGNDSGCYNVYANNKPLEDSELESQIYDLIADNSEYGSFAGDYSVSGRYDYNIEDGTFYASGTEYTSENRDLRLNLPIEVPKYLWFSEMDINFSGDEGGCDCTVRLIVKNGPISEDHLLVQEDIGEKLSKEIEIAINHFEESVEYISDNVSFSISDFSEKDSETLKINLHKISVVVSVASDIEAPSISVE